VLFRSPGEHQDLRLPRFNFQRRIERLQALLKTTGGHQQLPAQGVRFRQPGVVHQHRVDAVSGGSVDSVEATEAETPPENLRHLGDASTGPRSA